MKLLSNYYFCVSAIEKRTYTEFIDRHRVADVLLSLYFSFKNFIRATETAFHEL